ncbi:hypothetical protein [Salinimicrobium sp. WS361]|uniref:hypothetical protein n=1 Tax=Salinimicrobium sp. WS361 TaxID=3425123 RepID=UPI003D7001F2
MRTIFFFFVFLFGITSNTFGQDVNKYKYVLVPQEFEFLKHPNQYQVNALTAFLLEKYGFDALYEEKIPANMGLCDVLKVNVRNDSSLFRSRLYVTLENCNDEVVFTSKTGSSREKNYKKSYHEALREAFTSFEGLSEGTEFIKSGVAVADTSAEKNPAEVVIDPVPAAKDIQEEASEVIIDPVPAANDTQEQASEVIVDPVVTSEEIEEATEESSALPEVVEKNENLQFVNGAITYKLVKTPAGYDLYREGEPGKFGTLLKSGGGENYLYSSKNISGNAFFDTHGNLIVEYLDPNSQQLISVKYSQKGQ